jgi:hypothetical protein
MNIQTVKTNLEQTIAGKEQLLESYKSSPQPTLATSTLCQMLKVNIDELKRILQDVEQCVFDYDELKADLKEANGRIRQLERENSDMGWQINPDRMGL